MGIIAHLKLIAPWSIYIIGAAGMLLSLTGKVRWALMVTLLLLPLRNVVDKIQELPAGTQFLDLLFFAMIVGWVLSSASNSKKFMNETFLNMPVIIMMVYLFISLFYGSFSLTGTLGIDRSSERVQDWKNFTLLPILFFLTTNNLPDKRWVMRAFWVMMGALVLVAYYTVSQVSSYTSIESRVKITGTFQFLGPNEVAAFLNQTAIILIGLYFCLRKHWLKVVLLGLILSYVYCIIFLYSRGAYLGLFLGLAVLFLLKNRKLLVPLVLILIFWQFVLPEKAIERIKETKNTYGELDQSSELRLVMWQRGMELFRENPLFGIGYGVFRSKDFGTGLHDTHNIYVKILVEQGLIGMFLFLYVVLAFCKQGFFLYQKGSDDFSRGLGLGLFASMFTLLLNNFFGDRWAYFELSAYTWAFAGLVARLSQPDMITPVAIDAMNDSNVSQRSEIKTTQKTTRKTYYK